MPGLIEAPSQIWLAVEPVDLRRGIDGLSAIVQQALGQAPCAGSAFVFRNRAGHRLKLLLWDGNGIWLCQRRLHRGHFIWPRDGDRCFSISQAQWGSELYANLVYRESSGVLILISGLFDAIDEFHAGNDIG